MGRKTTIDTYFHLEKWSLFEQELLREPQNVSQQMDFDAIDGDEDFSDVVTNDKAVQALKYFGYEHKITADIDLDTGDWKITHLDGRKIED